MVKYIRQKSDIFYQGGIYFAKFVERKEDVVVISFLSVDLSAEEPSFWAELWEAFYNTYFSADGLYFENLNTGKSSLVSLGGIIFGLFVGIMVASFAMVINKRVYGEFVRKLLYEECLSPESSKTLYELGYMRKYSIRNAVGHGTKLRCVIKCREEEEYYASLAEQRAEYEARRAEDKSLPRFREVPYKVNPNTDHFYIPEEKKYTAEMRFEDKGTNWLVLFAVAIVSIIGCIALLLVIPKILSLINDFMGMFNTNNNVL